MTNDRIELFKIELRKWAGYSTFGKYCYLDNVDFCIYPELDILTWEDPCIFKSNPHKGTKEEAFALMKKYGIKKVMGQHNYDADYNSTNPRMQIIEES